MTDGTKPPYSMTKEQRRQLLRTQRQECRGPDFDGLACEVSFEME